MDEFLDEIALLAKARFPVLYLLTHEEERVERALIRLAKREELGLWRWSISEGLRRPDGKIVPNTAQPGAALAELHQVKEPAFFALMDFHRWIDQAVVVRRLRDLQRSMGARRQTVLIVAPLLVAPPEIEKDITVLDVPLPSSEEVGKLLSVLLKRQKLDVPLELFNRYVRTSLGLTEREIKRCYARILLDGGSFDEQDIARLVEAKKQAIRRSRYLEFHDDVERISNVGGMGNLKEWLVRRSAAFSDEARRFGLPEPKGVFLLGVQGCGKSLMAKAVAGLFRIPLLRLDVSEVFRSTSGAEQGLRETIRVAESISPVVLWIDELEKAFMGSEDSGGPALGAFLTWLQEKKKPVFVVATANEVRALPPELLRKGRFDEIFFVDLPDVHERLQVLEIHLRWRDRVPDEFDLLACAEETEKYSGAELEQVVVEGMFNAYSEGRQLGDRDLIKVIRDTVPLAVTMDDRLKELREWARPRTRPATLDRRRIDFFDDFQEG